MKRKKFCGDRRFSHIFSFHNTFKLSVFAFSSLCRNTPYQFVEISIPQAWDVAIGSNVGRQLQCGYVNSRLKTKSCEKEGCIVLEDVKAISDLKQFARIT